MRDLNETNDLAHQPAPSSQHDLTDDQNKAHERIEYLFRACLRESRVHPLKDLLIRYLARPKQ